jgi:hypothetical protein
MAVNMRRIEARASSLERIASCNMMRLRKSTAHKLYRRAPKDGTLIGPQRRRFSSLGLQRHQRSGQLAHARYDGRATHTQHMSHRSPASPTQKRQRPPPEWPQVGNLGKIVPFPAIKCSSEYCRVPVVATRAWATRCGFVNLFMVRLIRI